MDNSKTSAGRETISGLEALFIYYKGLGEKSMIQISDDQFHHQINGESNSVAVIVKHLWGNMLSRWTNFLTEDGEKDWRQRDAEFEDDLKTRDEIMDKWNEGWDCLFNALEPLADKDLTKIIYIRNQGHTVQEAIYRQLAHYSYHVGQLVFLCKSMNDNWNTLSIAKNASQQYNKIKFDADKERKHFTQEYNDEK